MSKVWRWVAIAFSVLMIFGIALLAVAYATGGSFERLIQTTDIADMTKFVSRDQLLVMRDGTFIALPRGTYAAGDGQKYIDEGAVQSFTFGPLLVNDGEAVELPEKYIISTKDTIREPRTAIGQVDANHYVLVVADGRRDGWSDKGMTLQELQQVFVEQGCKVAYNLDGGGSATMILGSERVNKTSGSRERDVSDIVYFTK